MKIEKIKCDCCMREIIDNKCLSLTLPILTDNKVMVQREMDICAECATRFCKLYYQIAQEHSSTGFMALDMSDDPI